MDEYDFEMGTSCEVINFRALKLGKQIILCKKGRRRYSDFIFLLPKVSFLSAFEPSKHGKELMANPIQLYTTAYVAELEYIEIPAKKRKFWEELYKMGEFNLWKIDEGPMRYFAKWRRVMLFWFLRVYKIPFEIEEGDDFIRGAMGMHRMINDKTLRKIQRDFFNGKFKPVVSDREFGTRKKSIINIVQKHIG